MNRTVVTTTRRTALAAGVLALATVAGTAFAGSVGATTAPTTSPVATTAVDPNDPHGALLRADQMPVVNDEQHWTRVATRHTRMSRSQTGPLSDLSFVTKARRDFAEQGAQSTSVVLTFADTANAKAAYAEVKAWRKHTGDRIPSAGKLLFTGDAIAVDVPTGRASYFTFVYKTDRDADEGTFEWVGVTRRGAAVSIVAWRVNGADATYDVDPTIAPVQTANAKLARLG
jgi:hypothetical protein